MGAASAKAMRAGGMDDVIFAGAGSRPARNHADVTLTIDNADRRAPPAFNDDPVLEVTRRIDRGAGSTYRVNGREVAARDVQLLFADAATGANSPALVRQGQISELIAARPQNRRRILEEAAGVSGLHARRHEAELRLRGAETNLERLDDVAKELEGALGRLKREARTAEKYKRLSADIRALQGAVLHARWSEAAVALDHARGEAARAAQAVEAATREAAVASTAALAGAEGLGPLREEEVVAAAVLQRVVLEKDRLDRALAEARAAVDRAKAEVARIAADTSREAQLGEDAARTIRRLTSDLAAVEAEIAAAPAACPNWRRRSPLPTSRAQRRTPPSSGSPPRPRPRPPAIARRCSGSPRRRRARLERRNPWPEPAPSGRLSARRRIRPRPRRAPGSPRRKPRSQPLARRCRPPTPPALRPRGPRRRRETRRGRWTTDRGGSGPKRAASPSCSARPARTDTRRRWTASRPSAATRRRWPRRSARTCRPRSTPAPRALGGGGGDAARLA
jgi:predicted  nucleic acid-binding Zn-ribbon protein